MKLGICIALLLIVALTILPWCIGTYYTYFIFLMFYFAALAQSWNISASAGVISLGHIGLVGIGAYVYAILVTHQVPIHLSILLSGILTLPIGLLICPLLKLRGAYFTIATLGIPIIMKNLIIMFPSLTGGGIGLNLPPRTPSRVPDYYLALIILVISTFIVYFVKKSKYGLAVDAIFDDEDAANMMGVPTIRLKSILFLLSSFTAGLCGGIYAFSLPYISPTIAFGASDNVSILFVAFLGGVRTVLGPILGSIIICTMSELLRTSLPYFHMIIYGLLLVLGVHFFPGGIYPYIEKFLKRYTLRNLRTNGSDK